METIKDIQKRYGSAVMGLVLPVALVLILAGLPSAGKGLVLGSLFSVLNFVLMGQTLPLRLGRTRNAAFGISLGSLGFRYALLAIPLIVAIRYDVFHPAATVVGMFMVQIVILADHVAAAFRRPDGRGL
jgi:hypothetical protein